MTFKLNTTMSRFERDQFAELTERQARRIAREQLHAIGRDMVEAVTGIVSSEYERREGERHKEEDLHLDESFEYRVFEGPNRGFPMRVELTTKPEANVKKIAALRYGTKKRYVIKPRKKQTLAWGDTGGSAIEAGDDATFTKEVVRFPSNSAQPNNFMQRARAAAMRRHRARQR